MPTSTILPYFLQAGCPSCRSTNSVKALKAFSNPLLTTVMHTKDTNIIKKPRFACHVPCPAWKWNVAILATSRATQRITISVMTSGHSTLTTGRIATTCEWFSGIRHVAPVCTTTQYMLPWAHPSCTSKMASRSVQLFLHSSRQ